MSDVLLHVQDIHAFIGQFHILEGVSVAVPQGGITVLLGRNGAGKSTLLKILSRITEPTTGRIQILGRIGSLLEVGTGFHPELTGRENIYLNGAILGMNRAEIGSKLDEIVEFSGCQKYIDTPVKRYSSGMIVRLGFAVAAHLEPEILIVDEVLAVGDAEFQDKCIGKMKDISGEGRTVLFVSHNMASMKALCKKGFLMEKGRMTNQGNMTEIIETYLAKATKSSANGEIPADAATTVNNIKINGNPWGVSQDDRFNWSEGLDIPIIEAGNRNKKSVKEPFPAVQAINVVISPNGDHAPPAFAETTILIAPGTKKSNLFFSIVIKTVAKISAVVKLSAIGDKKNAIRPVAQNNCLYVYPFVTSLYFKTSNTPM